MFAPHVCTSVFCNSFNHVSCINFQGLIYVSECVLCGVGMSLFLVSMSAFHTIALYCFIKVYSSQYRLQVTVIEVFPPPVPEGLPTPTSSATPSSMSSPANGLTPLTSRDPSPSVETHVSVIVNATTPMTNTLSSNKYVNVCIEICCSHFIIIHCCVHIYHNN